MHHRFSGFSGAPILVALLVGGMLRGGMEARAQSRGRAIEFSEPRTTQVLTNLNQLREKKDNPRPFEEDREFRGFDRSSLQGVPAPVYRLQANPLIMNARVRELLDKRKNWIFANPDDPTPGTTAESIFNLREFDTSGNEKKKSSVVELYIERQKSGTTKNQGTKDSELNSASRGKDSLSDLPPLADDATLPVSLRRAQQELQRNLLDSERTQRIFGEAPTPTSFSDMFGLGNRETLKDPRDPSKDLNPEFHPILGGPNAPGINSLAPLSQWTSFQDPRAVSAPVNTMESLVPETVKAPTPAESVSSISAGAALPDFGARSVSQWNPMASPLPQVEAPKIAPPVSMPDFPRRKGI
jgi:hypothetical protein